MNRVDAPFTREQVESLNGYQRAGYVHPFTCNAAARRDTHTDGEGVLVATTDGWVCPDHPDYRQTWAHDFMADGSWREFGREMADHGFRVE